MFSLDDVVPSVVGSANAVGVWQSGSRLAGNSWTALSGTYEGVLDEGYNRFTVPLCGGYDGLDITEKDPFNHTRALNGTDSTKYAYYSVKRAIDTVADPEVVEYNLMAMPGIYKEGLTSHMVEVCESRERCSCSHRLGFWIQNRRRKHCCYRRSSRKCFYCHHKIENQSK